MVRRSPRPLHSRRLTPADFAGCKDRAVVHRFISYIQVEYNAMPLSLYRHEQHVQDTDQP